MRHKKLELLHYLELDLMISGTYIPATRETRTDPSWPAEIEDLKVMFGNIDITNALTDGQIGDITDYLMEAAIDEGY